MKKSRLLLIGAQVLAAVLFVYNFDRSGQSPWWAWLTPLAMVIFIIMNSIWFTRFISWVIFAVSFFAFMALLSAFTLRWRFEPGFNSMPFYMSIIMYVVFIYVGLGQLKILGGSQPASPMEVSR